MVLELAPGSSALVRGAAAVVLSAHITAGVVGLASGTIAMLARKGSPLHRRAGNWFFGAILAMAGIGAAVAPFLPDRGSAVGGLFTVYLAATSWVTIRRREGSIGSFEYAAFGVALFVVAADSWLAWLGAHHANGLIDGVPYQACVVFASIATLAAASDLKVIARGGIRGAARIARHLWRMGLAFWIAAASFFLGQQQVFPQFLRGSFVLALPVIAVLAAMIYWLVRVRFFTSRMERA